VVDKMTDEKIKHLEMIQNIITRMAKNSFLLKGWTVTLLAGIFALVWEKGGFLHYLLAYIPVFMFWFLDAYYLQQERLYRGLYDEVRQSSTNILFSMSPPSTSTKSSYCYINVLFSKTEVGFYVPLIVLITVILIATTFNFGCQCLD
jgi:hypothetical protein